MKILLCVFLLIGIVLAAPRATPTPHPPPPPPPPPPPFAFQGFMSGNGISNSTGYSLTVTVDGAAGTVAYFNHTANIKCAGFIHSLQRTGTDFSGSIQFVHNFGSSWCPPNPLRYQFSLNQDGNFANWNADGTAKLQVYFSNQNE